MVLVSAPFSYDHERAANPLLTSAPMSLMTITETLARTLIAQGTGPQPRRVITPEGTMMLNNWVKRVAEDPRRQDLRLWVLQASQEARASGPGDDVDVIMPATISKSGKAETLTMPRHLFFWQVEAG